VKRRDFWYPVAFRDWDEREFDAMRKVIESGWFTMGPEVEAFEAEFAAYHKMKYAVMVNSGSSANLVAVSALFHLKERPALQRGDKVLVPALAWATTYAPLVQNFLDMSLLDCDATWNSGECFSADDSARLIVGCSILGGPSYLHAWSFTASAIGSHFIEDNCESIGASNYGKLCGTHGLMNTFSFFHSHQLSAIEGGMILTNDFECFELCRMLRDHGMTRSVREAALFDEEYDFRLMGYNLRPAEINAAVARVQLEKLDGFIKGRQRNHQIWLDAIEGLPITPQRMQYHHNPFGLAFTVKDKETRNVLADLLRESDIDCRLPTGGSFSRHHYGRDWRNQSTPNADRIHDTALFLGNASFDISDKIERSVKVMRSTLL